MAKDGGFSEAFVPERRDDNSEEIKVAIDNKDDDVSSTVPPTEHKFGDSQDPITAIDNKDDDVSSNGKPVLLPYSEWNPVKMCGAVVKLSVELYDDDNVVQRWGRSTTITETGFIYASTDECSIVWGLAHFLIDENGELRPGKVVVTLAGGIGKKCRGTVLHVDFHYKLVVIKIYCKKQQVARWKSTSEISDKRTKVICLDHWFMDARIYCSLYALRYPDTKGCEHRLHVDRHFVDFAAVVLDVDDSIIGLKRDACPIHPQIAYVLAMEKVVELLTPVTSRCLDTCHDLDIRGSLMGKVETQQQARKTPSALHDSPSTQRQQDAAILSKDQGKSSDHVKSKKQKRRRGKHNKSSLESLAESAKRIAIAMERPNIGNLQTELKKLPNIGTELLLKAVNYLGRDAGATHIFMGLEDELKMSWLEMVLN